MTNNKQQTAVEWFNSKIKQLEFWVETRQITWKEYHKEKDKLIEQAKEMQKQQMIEFSQSYAVIHCMGDITKNAYEYYNETYGGGNK
jgi:hypothetical protein